jgi:Caulimovirus viroplasmin
LAAMFTPAYDRSGAAPKESLYYAVARGKQIGVYATAEDAKEQTDGILNAVCRDSETLEEAKAEVDRLRYKPREYYAIRCNCREIYTDRADALAHQWKKGAMQVFSSLEEAAHFLEDKDYVLYTKGPGTAPPHSSLSTVGSSTSASTSSASATLSGTKRSSSSI